MSEAYKPLDPETMPRSPGITYQELLDQDSRPVPDVLRLQSPKDMGLQRYSVKRYTSAAWHELEVERLWKKVWQFTCREEDIPEPGDHYRYDIAGMSFLIVRTETGELKAYPNACLHRGRMLKEFDGNAAELRCPFHGFCWKLDGQLKDIPADWDFPQIDQSDFSLPEIPLAVWAGFIFINPDQNCDPFDDFIKDLAEQFERWNLGGLYKQAHAAKVMPCNWKIAQEAFCEAFHVNATHPQIMRSIGDVNSQVDVWENCSRVITAGGTHSPLLTDVSNPDLIRAMMDLDHDAEVPEIPEGVSLRTFLADRSRENLKAIAGDRAETYCDAELMDSLDYTLFPNFHPWGAFNGIVYRFRPNGNDHRSSIMECMMLAPFEGERPPAAKVHWLEEDETWSSVLGFLGKVFDQDSFNMPKVQQGLEATYMDGIVLSGYQESKVRWLHHKLTEWVGE
ncbi:aromatic ring-hydroxylating dioxygenase subunit alpha [Pseudomonadales bacterium]|jgi:nitrite reductase/ring-hydroxylating ferredoxin subunit|nr:aromatic ring-hydroxylating dioxygenase subunit alpha [Pseudomonadales bacterium]MDA8911636.1 aromatic ring-hydroxylating dioxygenase subunit alpha [Pseudomonadales bacterium]MDA8950741.1 aromatic ring-hydroxylating dioxygenase subunit alpha [Pseudomonadales bacterium]MDB4035545.1 aromatic ring-hydroxylating dioxygenase subunit alpha [Pseudomonadales bacterium]MDC3357534.1 aromatic ring-hydroxylating dioxygenase subunit alpha [Pseudomonadales bacterium]